MENKDKTTEWKKLDYYTDRCFYIMEGESSEIGDGMFEQQIQKSEFVKKLSKSCDAEEHLTDEDVDSIVKDCRERAIENKGLNFVQEYEKEDCPYHLLVIADRVAVKVMFEFEMYFF